MSDEVAKRVDDFAGFEDNVEGEEPRASALPGRRVKFGNDGIWRMADNEEEVPQELELIFAGIKRMVVKWMRDNQLDHNSTIHLGPGQKFPDTKKMNEECSRDEWVVSPDGKLQGPWRNQQVWLLLNPNTMDKYSFPTSTIGGAKATRDIVDKTNWMRGFRGSGVYPVVQLSDTFMPTKFSGRQRPHLIVKRWIAFTDDPTLPTAEVKSLPEPTTVADPPSK